MHLYATPQHSSTIDAQDDRDLVGLLQTAIGDGRLQRIHLHVLSLIVDHRGIWPGSIAMAAMAGTNKKSLANVLAELRGAGYLAGYALASPNIVPPTRNHSAMKDALRKEAISEFGQRCVHCAQIGTAESGPDQKPWTLDRIRPGSFGGLYRANNVALSCGTCNSRRGTAPATAKVFSLAQWQALRSEWRDVGAGIVDVGVTA